MLKNIPQKKILFANQTAIAIEDNFPVSEGHSLIFPKRKVSDWFALNKDELGDILELAEFVKSYVDEHFKPDGYNIGLNIGEAGGQTIEQIHLHVIPRYKGDVLNPRGGVRMVIPDRADYK